MLSAIFLAFLTAQAQAHAAYPQNQTPAPGAYVNENGGPLIPLLQGAQQKIDIEVYTMTDATVRSLIRAALKRGVKVRIVKDPNPLGVKCNVFGSAALDSFDANQSGDASAADCADQQKLVQDVRDAGGQYVPFDKSALCPNGGGAKGDGCFEHGKIAVIDSVAVISSGNFDTPNLCLDSEKPRTCYRDYTLVVTDSDVIDTLERIFQADLAGARYDVGSMIPGGLQGKLTVSPISEAPIVAFIDTARDSLLVETQYLKEPAMNAAIVRAAQRGVKVSVITASACAFGKPSDSEARDTQTIYSAFDAAGVTSRMFTVNTTVNGHEGYLHAKAIVVDGTQAWVGSENGSTESLTQNREYGLVFDNANDVATVGNQIQSDLASDGDESWQDALTCAGDKAGQKGSTPLPSQPDPVKKPPKKKK